MRAYHNTAVSLLQTAGKTITQNMDRTDRIHINKNRSSSFETSIAVDIEGVMTERLQELYPTHHVLSRYGGLVKREIENNSNEKSLTWVIDGLDGAENFIAGVPIYAHSIALFEEKNCIMGLTYQPITDEMFSAINEHGAFYNNKKIRAQRKHPEQPARLALQTDHFFETVIHTINKKFKHPLKVSQVQSFGSVSLGLAYHALGAYDVFFAQDIHICSAAAGLLIATQAGAIVKQDLQNERILSQILSVHNGVKKS